MDKGDGKVDTHTVVASNCKSFIVRDRLRAFLLSAGKDDTHVGGFGVRLSQGSCGAESTVFGFERGL